MCAQLWIPDNFPASSSIDPDGGRWRPDENECDPIGREMVVRVCFPWFRR